MEMRKGNTIFFIHYCLLDMFFHKSNLSATNLILSNIGKKERGKGGEQKKEDIEELNREFSETLLCFKF